MSRSKYHIVALELINHALLEIMHKYLKQPSLSQSTFNAKVFSTTISFFNNYCNRDPLEILLTWIIGIVTPFWISYKLITSIFSMTLFNCNDYIYK